MSTVGTGRQGAEGYEITSLSFSGGGIGRVARQRARQVANHGCASTDARPCLRHGRPHDGLLRQVPRSNRHSKGADEGGHAERAAHTKTADATTAPDGWATQAV